MAGSGKTTLVQQMTAYMGAQKHNGYVINLDPAVHNLPYDPNIDIRDTVRTQCSLLYTRCHQEPTVHGPVRSAHACPSTLDAS